MATSSGTFLRYSDDLGETWQEVPKRHPVPRGERAEAHQHLDSSSRDGRTSRILSTAGVDPASLWVSKDNGETWDMIPAWRIIPTRERWGPGAGGLCLHSIVPDHSNPDRMWIGISAVGCMRTDDGGKTWTHANKNTRAGFQPDIYPEYGQCIHRLIQHPTEPDVLYQQNHCGVYMSDRTAAMTGSTSRATCRPSSVSPSPSTCQSAETLFTIVEDGRAATTSRTVSGVPHA